MCVYSSVDVLFIPNQYLRCLYQLECCIDELVVFLVSFVHSKMHSSINFPSNLAEFAFVSDYQNGLKRTSVGRSDSMIIEEAEPDSEWSQMRLTRHS